MRLHQPVAQHEVPLQLGAAQVEVAVPQPQLLRGELLALAARHGNGRRVRRADDAQRRSRAPRRPRCRAPGSASPPDAAATTPSTSTTVSAPSDGATCADLGRRGCEDRTRPARGPRDRAGRRRRARRGRAPGAPSRRAGPRRRRARRAARRRGACESSSPVRVSDIQCGRSVWRGDDRRGRTHRDAARTRRARRSDGHAAKRRRPDGGTA